MQLQCEWSGERRAHCRQPRGSEAEVPLELQEQPEERETVDRSSVKCSLLYVIWHGNLFKCYFRRQEENVSLYSPLARRRTGLYLN